MFDNLKNLKELAGMMGNLGEMKTKLEEAQQALAHKTAQGEAGAGAVRVVMNGKFEVQSVTIDPAMVGALAGAGSEADREMVEELLAAAFNDAVLKVQELMKDSLGDVTGGLNLPGM
ncbi:MAG: YbaB/EbfC family nucleoid-associated protein [Phycisphaerales bacterium JB063]